MLGFLEEIKMIIQDEIGCIDSLPIESCQDGRMEVVVIEVFAFPDVSADDECGFGDLGVRNLKKSVKFILAP